MRSGLPDVPELQQCIKLMEVASRVMMSFATAPEAASAASVLAPPIGMFLTAVGDVKPEGTAQQVTRARRPLLSSVQLLPEELPPLLTSASLAARGRMTVAEAVSSVMHAIRIAVRLREPDLQLTTGWQPSCCSSVKRHWPTPRLPSS